VTSSSFITVAAAAGIPSIVDAVNGAPVDPFTGLVISLL
jgi:seryl-tRNA(Sec) selenium transferase